MQITPDSLMYYLVLLLIVGNVFALIIGVLMLAAPQRLDALSQLSNRWISTRQMTRSLAKPRESERVMLRYPRALGAVLLASAGLILVKGAIFVTSLSPAEGGRMLARLYGASKVTAGWESLWLTLIGFIAIGALTAVVVGLMAMFRMDLLRRWSESANRWVSTRRATRSLDIPRYPLDRLVAAKPRVWGGVITALALFSVLVLWVFVLGV